MNRTTYKSLEWLLNHSVRLAVCALVINSEGKILAVSRKDNPNAFGLVGGKIDVDESFRPKESLLEGLRRELKEETGLDLVGTPTFIFQRKPDPYDKYITATFLCNVSGEIHTEETGVVAWVDRETLIQGPFGEYNKNLFEVYDRYWKDKNV